MTGGELFNRIQERSDTAFTERGQFKSKFIYFLELFT